MAPQGGGLLNAYGRSIDQAQSLRGGEYQPSHSSFIQALDWGGRITQDIRAVIQEQANSTTNQPGTDLLRARIMYRNATEFGGGLRITVTVTGENVNLPRPALAYDAPSSSSAVFVNTALLSYRPLKNLEFSLRARSDANGNQHPRPFILHQIGQPARLLRLAGAGESVLVG